MKKRAKKIRPERPPTDEEIFESIHKEDLEGGGVIELGSTTPDQGSLFERMRTRISHGHMLKSTFDEAVKRRCSVGDYNVKIPKSVTLEVFDRDIIRIQNMTDEEVEIFDAEMCRARMERRAEGGGVYISQERVSGFGSDVFGFAYDLCSGMWCSTNELGLHAYCAENLSFSIQMNKTARVEIISGFIFQLKSVETPIMTPYGYAYRNPELMKKGFEDLWSWKKFIPMADVEIMPGKYRWKKFFTPEHAEEVARSFL